MHRANTARRQAELRAVAVQHRGAAAAAFAECEILASDDASRADLAGQYLFDPLLGGHRCHGCVKVEHQHRISAGGSEEFLPLIERG